MPSLTEIANQVNNTLNQINTNTQDTASTAALIKGDTADIKNTLNTLLFTTQAGFNAVVHRQDVANHLLDHMRQQNDTVICWLTNIADLLCRQLHRLNSQLAVQTQMAGDLGLLRDTLELVHPRETVEVLRRRELEERLEKCCPEPEPPRERCYEPCRSPEFRPRPIPDQPTGPVG